MQTVEINDVASIGQVNDLAPYLLPPEAWTDVTNVRYNGDRLERMSGWEETLIPSGGSRLYAPHFIMSLKDDSQTYWLYTSLTKAAVFDGTDDTDITRVVGGDYAANATEDWNGTILGGIAILNNGVDVPQAWLTPSPSTELVALPNWDTNARAKIVRAFGSYLVAFNITESGDRYPQLMWWSHPADPGSVPSSWDYTDPEVDAGRVDLVDPQSGAILEALPLGDLMIVYKTTSIWKIRYIGGQFIMESKQWLEDVGILAARCVCTYANGTRHFVVTQDDILVHNGNTVDSVVTDRQKQTLFNDLNRDTATTAFCFLNAAKDEVWFCYPTSGDDQPTKALVWNYKRGKGAISYVTGITFRNAAVGDLEGADEATWEDGEETWDEEVGAWGEVFRRRVVVASPDNSKLYYLDAGTERDGETFPASAIRTGLSVVGRDRRGQWIVDHKTVKMVDSLWPKMSGGPINIRVGYAETVDGPVTWQGYTAFDPDTDMYIHVLTDETLPGSGRSIAIEFSTTAAIDWSLAGYKMDLSVLGQF